MNLILNTPEGLQYDIGNKKTFYKGKHIEADRQARLELRVTLENQLVRIHKQLADLENMDQPNLNGDSK